MNLLVWEVGIPGKKDVSFSSLIGVTASVVERSDVLLVLNSDAMGGWSL